MSRSLHRDAIMEIQCAVSRPRHNSIASMFCFMDHAQRRGAVVNTCMNTFGSMHYAGEGRAGRYIVMLSWRYNVRSLDCGTRAG